MMRYTLTGFTHDKGARVFAFERVGEDRGRTEYWVSADLALVRRYGIQVQELPLLCRGLLERHHVEPNDSDLNHVEPNYVEPNHTEPNHTEPNHTEPNHPEPKQDGGKAHSFTFTEEDMRQYAQDCATARRVAAQKRKPPRRPPSENLGVAWRTQSHS